MRRNRADERIALDPIFAAVGAVGFAGGLSVFVRSDRTLRARSRCLGGCCSELHRTSPCRHIPLHRRSGRERVSV